MDFSNFPKNSKYYNTGKMLKIGLLKDDLGGDVIAEIVGLRSKLYTVLLANLKTKQAHKRM